jgi:hypothetical protein
MKIIAAVSFIILVGCSARSPGRIEIQTVTNYPDSEFTTIIMTNGVTHEAKAEHVLNIHADNARLQDLVRSITEHENLKLEFEAEVGNAFCTVNLVGVQPLPAIESIVKLYDCVVTQKNDAVIVKNKPAY